MTLSAVRQRAAARAVEYVRGLAPSGRVAPPRTGRKIPQSGRPNASCTVRSTPVEKSAPPLGLSADGPPLTRPLEWSKVQDVALIAGAARHPACQPPDKPSTA